MSISIRQVRDRRALAEFVELPTRLHGAAPYRVAPLREVLKRRLRGRALTDDPDKLLLLAERDGEVVGSISVLRDRRHEQHRGEPAAFFGFFEAIDDVAVARALLEAAADRARTWGATSLRGPRNFSRVEAVGVLVDGHDSPNPMLAGWTPSYYATLLEAAGLTPRYDALAYETALVHPDGAPRPLPDALRDKADGVTLPGLVVRDANRWRLRRDLTLAHEVFVDAFREVPENTPMPRRQFVRMGRVMLAASRPSMLQLATVGGAAAGFALCFPELNEAAARAQGRLLPLGWLRILAGLRLIRTASFKLIGVLPEHRGSGLHAAMIARAIDGAQRAGYTRLEASLIDERNGASRALVEGAGMTVYKRYRVYEQAL